MTLTAGHSQPDRTKPESTRRRRGRPASLSGSASDRHGGAAPAIALVELNPGEIRQSCNGRVLLMPRSRFPPEPG